MESTKAVETAKKEGVIFPPKDATPKKTDTLSEQNLEYLNELLDIKWQKGSFLSQLAGKQNKNEIIQQLKPLTEKVKDFNRILNEKRTAMEPLTDELDKMLAQAKVLTSNKNTATFGTSTITNMDEFLAQWTNKEFCEDYANCIHQSPEHDFLGELIRNQNEEPILAPEPVKLAEPKPSPVPTPLPKPALTKHCKEEAIAKAEDEVKAKSGANLKADNVKGEEEVDLEKLKKLKEEEIVERKKNKAEKKKLARARKKALKEAEEKIKLCAEPKPSPVPTPLPKPALTKHCKEEAIVKAEDEVKTKSGANLQADNVKEKEEVDLEKLEKLKEEEIAKNKMALERKKKLAEKRLARAEKKAIKEAEEKIKKKDKKAKKKGAGSAPEGSKDVTETELNPEAVEAENDSKDESNSVQSKFKSQKESGSTVIQQRGSVKNVQSQIPRAILRKKSHSYRLSWAPLSALVLLVLAVLLGLYYCKYYYLARHQKS